MKEQTCSTLAVYRKKFCLGLSFVAFALIMSSSAHADIVYPFIKMSCDNNSALFELLYVDNQAGRDLSINHHENVFPLEDQKNGTSTANGSCTLSGNHTLSFHAIEGDTPKQSGFDLTYDDIKIPFPISLGYGEWVAKITKDQKSDSQFSAIYCPPDSLSRGWGEDGKCTALRFSNGRLTGNETIDPPTSILKSHGIDAPEQK